VILGVDESKTCPGKILTWNQMVICGVKSMELFPLVLLKPGNLNIMLRVLSEKGIKHFLSYSSLMRLFSSLVSISVSSMG
jgi:hypothetical protein